MLKFPYMIAAEIKSQQVRIGDTVRIHSRVVEAGKTRVQVFEGIVISIRGRGENKTFTVRRVGAGGIGVERIWPIDSGSIVKVEVKRRADNVRRSKLYYLRELTGRRAVRV